MHYLSLLAAIVFEVAGTTALQASRQFTQPGPTALVVVCYLVSVYFMALALKAMPVGIVYAVWSGLGIVGIALISVFWFGQRLDSAAIAGLALIVAGVLVIHLFSKSVPH